LFDHAARVALLIDLTLRWRRRNRTVRPDPAISSAEMAAQWRRAVIIP
jgi:hypothetical protein